MNETSTEEFFSAWGDEDNQTEDTETVEETESAESETDESAQKPEEAAQTEETAEPSKDTSEEQKEPEKAADDTRTYVLRVNHEDKTVTEEEYRNFAQMGVDYSRVKANLEQTRTEKAELQSRVDEMQGVYDELNRLAEASGLTTSEMMHEFRKTKYTAQGYSEREAELAMKNDDLNAKLATYSSEPKKPENSRARADREITEFSEKYPDVAVTEELVSKLIADVQSGMSLTEAYQKLLRTENEQKIAERDNRIKELEAALAAEKQNAQNRASSPGTLTDGGKKPKRTASDDFFDYF